MKTTAYISIIMFVMQCGYASESPLDPSDALQILDKLCQNQKHAWIQQGRIQAEHERYFADTGERIKSIETIVTDGDRFWWEIRVQQADVPKNSKADQGLWQENKDRLFVWDGQQYTLYFKTGRQAIVYEAGQPVPVKVSGPLTAGYVPWGYGAFTFEKLSSCLVSSTLQQSGEGDRIYLKFQPKAGLTMEFVLDPAHDDAAVSYTLLQEKSRLVQTYGNFELCQGHSVPTNILIDRYQNNELISTDSWEITVLEDTPPQTDQFQVQYQDQDLIEYHSAGLEKASFYRHSGQKKLEPLLEKRILHELKKSGQPQNCGSAAAGYILDKFGVQVSDDQLSSLIDSSSKMTSLFQIQQLIRDKGLYCQAVKTSTGALSGRTGSQILLHLPGKKHFVVMDRADTKKIWLVDLDRQFFYHDMPVSQFEQEWAGIALIVSTEPMTLAAGDVPVPDEVLKNIFGSAYYDCTDLIQENSFSLCPEKVLTTCVGRYTVHCSVYGCRLSSDISVCSGTRVLSSVFTPCIEDIYNYEECAVMGEYTARYTRGCLP